MAHEIDESTGKAAVFVTGDPPWHGLGTVVKEAVTGSEALKLAHLDWTVQQWPLQAIQGTQYRNVPRFRANVRSDTHAVLGVVSEKYRVFQNNSAFDFMDSLVGEKLAMYHTAGALQGGRRVWMLVKIPAEFRAGKDDLIEPYILLTNNHDGLGALRIIPTTVRVVCQNTLNLALYGQESSGETIWHCQSLDDRVLEARRKLGIVTHRFEKFGEELEILSKRSINTGWLSSYFLGVLPPAREPGGLERRKRVLNQWRENFENPRNTLTGIRGTAWAAYNAISEWTDHQRPYRGSNAVLKAERRLNSVWFGQSNQLKQHAYRLALSTVQNN